LTAGRRTATRRGDCFGPFPVCLPLKARGREDQGVAGGAYIVPLRAAGTAGTGVGKEDVGVQLVTRRKVEWEGEARRKKGQEGNRGGGG